MFARRCYGRFGREALFSASAALSILVAFDTAAAAEEKNRKTTTMTFCEAAAAAAPQTPHTESPTLSSSTKQEEWEKEKAYYRTYGRFHPQRQVHRPFLPYPAWDYNWDGRQTSFTSPSFFMLGGEAFAASKAHGTTRHIILIRHGQYDESSKLDEERRLTPLGRHQAALTGQRLAIMARGGLHGLGNMLNSNDDNNNKSSSQQQQQPCRIKAIHVSDMTRAKETAQIIASFLPDSVPCNQPDPMLNEALPSPMIPMRPDIRPEVAAKEIDDNHDRIEAAFHKYIHRADPADMMMSSLEEDDPNNKSERDDAAPTSKHEFEVIVGHGNVLRYFTCRALQLPPEAWLRLACFNCSITYLMIHPNGYVSCRAFGDMGHIDYDSSTFSGKHGYHWA